MFCMATEPQFQQEHPRHGKSSLKPVLGYTSLMENSFASFTLKASLWSPILLHVILLPLCSATPPARTAATPTGGKNTTDIFPLLSFKSIILEDPTQALASWNSTLHFCRWFGVTCSRRHPDRVTEINLASLNLTGKMSPSLANLTFLQRLNLPDNRFLGSIPPEFGNLRRLQYLNLSANSLEGDIPATLSQCSRLQTISLRRNRLRGEVPSNLSQYMQLQIMLLNDNRLTGGIPGELGSLPKLVYLDLSNNNLTGGIPTSLGNASSLLVLYLSNNDLSGRIPPSLGRLPLAFLYLGRNNLVGAIPSAFQNLTSLMYFSLFNNKLTEGIPAWFGNLSSLGSLDVTSNDLAGAIPPSLGQLSSVTDLALTDNAFSGSIPPSLGSLSNLNVLALSHNQLSGAIPPSLYNLSTINYFGVANNLLTGTIPKDIGDTLPGLRKLFMYFNRFEGPIPASLANATGLEDIELTGNQFSGKIPSNLGKLQGLTWLTLDMNQFEASNAEDWSFLSSLTNCSNLQVLELNKNKLQGELPSSVANLSTMLQWLQLGDNQISGSLPVEIGRYSNLEFLDMKHNLLGGHIPVSIGNLQRLEILDLSTNSFSGPIPTSLGNLTLLSELYLIGNALVGSIPTNIGELQGLRHLDLSYNNLNGTVPKEVVSIASLTKYLGLSHNSLTGILPLEIGNLRNLIELDLSENHLSGEIPSSIGECQVLEKLYMGGNLFQGVIPSSMSNLKGLIELDLSRNNLAGHIPDFFSSFKFLHYLNLSFNEFDGEVPMKGVFSNASAVSIKGNNNLCSNNRVLQLQPCITQGHKRKHWSLKLKVIISVALAIFSIFLSLTLIYVLLRVLPKRSSPTETSVEGQHMMVSYSDLLKATDGFSSSSLIGVGGYGSVYKGVINLGSEKVVAVKVLNLQQQGASKSFLAECEALRNIRHRNLVKMLTSCSSVDFKGNDFKALVFEYMPNDSLELWLHPKANEQNQIRKLSFITRLNIAIDVASALDYLHHHGSMQIVHCDLKPSNVLLDNDMTAHVSDFGLAKFLHNTTAQSSENSSTTIAMKGTIGYVAPEYGVANQVSTLGDVYSFGILLLEMFTGRRPVEESVGEDWSLHSFVKNALLKGLTDIVVPSLLQEDGEEVDGRTSETSALKKTTQDCVFSVLQIGLICANESPSERMNMGKALNELHAIRDAFFSARNQGKRRNRQEPKGEGTSYQN